MEDIIIKFDHRIINPDPHIVTLLGEIDTGRGEFRAGMRMNPRAITSLRKSTLITSAGASTRIEGAKLTDEEVDTVMRGLRYGNTSQMPARRPQARSSRQRALHSVQYARHLPGLLNLA